MSAKSLPYRPSKVILYFESICKSFLGRFRGTGPLYWAQTWELKIIFAQKAHIKSEDNLEIARYVALYELLCFKDSISTNNDEDPQVVVQDSLAFPLKV